MQRATAKKSGLVEFIVAAPQESEPRFRVAIHGQGCGQVSATRAHESARERERAVRLISLPKRGPCAYQRVRAHAATAEDGEGRWKQRRSTAPATSDCAATGPGAKSGAPAEYRRRLCFGKVVALRRPRSGPVASRALVHMATLLPNPSLERRPREACHPWAAQASRRLHYPARPKSGPPHGSPQLER
jgi:hypothetical protein